MGTLSLAFAFLLKGEIAMPGTYCDPKGHKWHVPGKVDHDADPSQEVLVDGNGRATKIGTDSLQNGDSGESSRGLDQVNISAMSVGHTHPSASQIQHDHNEMGSEASEQSQHQRTLDERQPPPRQEGLLSKEMTTSVERQQRQYPDGNKPSK